MYEGQIRAVALCACLMNGCNLYVSVLKCVVLYGCVNV